jgi:hypothetical protein
LHVLGVACVSLCVCLASGCVVFTVGILGVIECVYESFDYKYFFCCSLCLFGVGGADCVGCWCNNKRIKVAHYARLLTGEL